MTADYLASEHKMVKRALIASAFTMLLVFPREAYCSDSVLKIGVLTDMSGPLQSYYGAGSVEAVKLAVEDFGGTVQGKKIEVISADHQNKADIGVAILKRWYDAEDVSVAIDLANSAVSLAAVEIAKSRNKVAIFVGAGSSLSHGKNCTPNTVFWGNDVYAMANAVTRSITKSGDKTWFFMVSDYAFGHLMQSEATKAIGESGGTVVGAVRHPFNTSDFSSFLLQAQSSKAQVIGLLNSLTDLQNSIKQAQEFGITRNQRIIAPGFSELDAEAIGLGQAQGTISSTIFYWNRSPDTREFAERFAKRFGAAPTPGQAADYSGTLQYLKAVARVGDLDGTAVVKAMKNIPVSGFFAKNAVLRQDGRLVFDLYLVRVKTPNAVSTVGDKTLAKADVFDVIETIPGSDAFEPLSVSECPLVTSTAAPR